MRRQRPSKRSRQSGLIDLLLLNNLDMPMRREFFEENGNTNNNTLKNSKNPAPIISSPNDENGQREPSQHVNASASGTPMKYVPIQKLYSTTTTSDNTNGNGNGNGRSTDTKVGFSGRKGKPRKLEVEGDDPNPNLNPNHNSKKLSSSSLDDRKPLLVYNRRRRKRNSNNGHTDMDNGNDNNAVSYHERLLNRARLREIGVGVQEGLPLENNTIFAADSKVEVPDRIDVQGTEDGVEGDLKGSAHHDNSMDIDKGVLQNSPESDSLKTAIGSERGEDNENAELKESHPDKSANMPILPVGIDEDGEQRRKKLQKKRKFEGIDLDIDDSKAGAGKQLRENKARKQRAAQLALNLNSGTVKQAERLAVPIVKSEAPMNNDQDAAPSKKKWIEVSLHEADPMALLNYKCKVYWPLDNDWYSGVIDEYIAEKNQHHVKYLDGEDEWLCLREEKMKLFISRGEMQDLKLKDSEEELISEMKKADYDEMAALAATLYDYQGEPGHGDLIWAKITGHSMWPAFVMDEAHANACDGLETAPREGAIAVQFFGSHDYARINSKQIMPLSKGFQSNFQQKCKRVPFLRGLCEAWRYLKEQRLPEEMEKLQAEVVKSGRVIENEEESEQSDGDEDCMGDERSEKIKKSVKCLFSCPIDIGGLHVLSLGKIVKDSEHFHDEHHIWTEGYTVIRKFTSIKVPGTEAEYKMEVLRNPMESRRPLFRITLEDGEQVDGSTPAQCWKKIYSRLDKAKQKLGNGLKVNAEKRRQYKSGSYMFGFSYHRIANIIQALPNARACSKYIDWTDKLADGNPDEVLPAGYRPVQVWWKDLDRCSVCHMEEEYLNNPFLQCDTCRMMVHANCYGEREPSDGELWHCQLCRPGAPKKCPPCCLCPIPGGAMKRTTDGRWAHLTCATWIPETCLIDIKRMEPIDGVNRISKDRWKLICSICEVPYGACIQCSDQNCRVAYHPLCARAAGLFIEVLEDKARHAGSADEDCEQNLRLLSFCKKHRQPTYERTPTDQQKPLALRDCSSYVPPSNLSGCARCEPYNHSERRGRKQPEAASIKRLFVENRPYLVSGCRRNGPWADVQLNAQPGLKGSCVRGTSLPVLAFAHQYSSMPQADGSRSFMSDKYEHMRATFRKRLAFGKSGIHGFGIFAKQAHKAGDMVIEYTGEIVRPIIADIREHFIYNSLVGAGTYMFRIDDERVIDATRAGSIAHLINHSCEPNCYSRVINVRGEDHIIIFAKRDIEQWEELTYDYRFFSIDEQLACYCGFPRCRGIVNVDDEEQVGKICVPRRDLIEWKPDDDK